MSKKATADATLSQVAEVRIGEYEVRLSADDLKTLYDIHASGDADCYPKFIDRMLDVFINYAGEHSECSQEAIGHMGILQDIKRDYRRCFEIDVRRVS
jgi:hypothetical protein